jgi:hypothetical protein
MQQWSCGVSIADHFEQRSDAGFVRVYDARSARRQFQVSVALVAVLSLAAMALGAVARFDLQLRATPPAAATMAGAPHFAEKLLDIGK